MNNILFSGDENAFQSWLTAQSYSQCILLADAHTHGFCIPLLTKKIPALSTASRIVIPAGEEHKNIDTCQWIWNELENINADRQSVLICVGGGMVTDIGGFAASVYKRGIDFIHFPTTLLAMVDAAYGGKNGIDYRGYKNELGLFRHARYLYIEPAFLQSLSARLIHSGMAEMIKHALLSGEDYWQEIQSYTAHDFCLLSSIQRSLGVKINIVQQDEFDMQIRQRLNWGHSIGHAIESYSLNQNTPLLHGEAIMLGMLYECCISETIFGLSSSIFQTLLELQQKFFPQLLMNYHFSDILPYVDQDKKNNQGYRMSLLKAPGECVVQTLVSVQQIQDVMI